MTASQSWRKDICCILNTSTKLRTRMLSIMFKVYFNLRYCLASIRGILSFIGIQLCIYWHIREYYSLFLLWQNRIIFFAEISNILFTCYLIFITYKFIQKKLTYIEYADLFMLTVAMSALINCFLLSRSVEVYTVSGIISFLVLSIYFTLIIKSL